MKKKLIIIGSIIGIIMALLICFYIIGAKPVSNKAESVTFTIRPGESKNNIINHLKEAGLIRSKYSAYVYLVTHNKFNIQAGTYYFKRNMSLQEVIDSLNIGKTNKLAKTVSITFVEGKTVLDYADLITENFGYSPDEIKTVLEDKDFLKELIEQYWFLDDVVLKDGIYYALEGYLFPDTYEFYEDASIKDIIIRMLANTESKLEPYKEQIKSSGYSAHEILTMASIIEKEAVKDEDRAKVSQVIYKRLGINMPLGMDVTTYYAAHKSLKENLTQVDLNSNSPYNTRNANLIGLPIGPICNVGLKSIIAALNPSNTNYLYFYADLESQKVYFAETQAEFLKFKKEIGGQ